MRPRLRARRGGSRGTAAMLVLAGLLLVHPGQDDRVAQPADGGADGARVIATVTRVVDGDTIEVDLAGQHETVRYIGVDTPETVDPDKPVQCFGHEASDFNHGLVEGKRVELAFDAERRDVYGRLLAYVYLDGDLVNAELARRGLARTLTIPPNDSLAPLFARLAAAAGQAGRGLWGSCGAD
jgi:micrococcal nuclease